MDKTDRQVVELNVNMFVLKQNSFLVLPETPNIYLSNTKAVQLAEELKNAAENSRDGIIIRFNGEINPEAEREGDDGSMFLSRELTVKEIKGPGGL
jgi:hypothetical protein